MIQLETQLSTQINDIIASIRCMECTKINYDQIEPGIESVKFENKRELSCMEKSITTKLKQEIESVKFENKRELSCMDKSITTKLNQEIESVK